MAKIASVVLISFGNDLTDIQSMEATDNCVYLVRHAQSEMNAAVSQAKQDGRHSQLPQVRQNARFIDAQLTEKGKVQALSLKDEFESLPITKVFVSPLRRTLQTAQIAFAGHPLNPQVIVLPLLSEQLKSPHGISMGLLSHEFPEFCWDLMPHYHYLYDLCSEEEGTLLRERSTSRSLQRVMLARIAEVLPSQWETKAQLEERAKKVFSMLSQELARADGSICIVSHRGVCRKIYECVHGKSASLSLANAQIKELSLTP